jgi:nucleoside-diphosphate-sugar epimerase
MSPSDSGLAGNIAHDNLLIGRDDPILVTGASGFIGSRVVASLLARGFRRIRCFTRSSSGAATWEDSAGRSDEAGVQWFKGNLLSSEDCRAATEDVAVVLHLAAGRGEKLFPDAFMNSVVTTRNLLEACVQHNCLKRFVNVSSFAVYTNAGKTRPAVLDETCPVESRPELRGEAYCFAKAKQDEIVIEYAEKQGIPYVIVRPGVVYGPGNLAITGRVGISTFGVFLHLGGSNPIPFTYVENCANAIVLAGLTAGIDGEVFNVVDDDVPTSRQFLRSYKRNVKPFFSLYVPHVVSYGLCYLWERYSRWSQGQLLPAFNVRRWRALWKKTAYSNEKLKSRLGWVPSVPAGEGFKRYFAACRADENNA